MKAKNRRKLSGPLLTGGCQTGGDVQLATAAERRKAEMRSLSLEDLILNLKHGDLVETAQEPARRADLEGGSVAATEALGSPRWLVLAEERTGAA